MAVGNVADTDVFKVKIGYEVQQQQCQFGWHVREETLGNATPDAIRDAVLAWVNTSYRNESPSFVRFLNIDVTALTGGGFSRHTFNNVTGAASGFNATAPHRAIRIDLRSSSRFRWRNGRMYLPLRSDTDVPLGVLSGTGLTVYSNILNTWTAAFVGLDVGRSFRACIVANRRTSEDVGDATARSWIDIETAVLALRETTMNSRKVGHGA